jgi:hypothetical protein
MADYGFCPAQVRTKKDVANVPMPAAPLRLLSKTRRLAFSRYSPEPIRSIDNLVRPFLQFRTPSRRLRTQEGILPLFQSEAARYSHFGLIDESLRRRKNVPNPSRAVIRCR